MEAQAAAVAGRDKRMMASIQAAIGGGGGGGGAAQRQRNRRRGGEPLVLHDLAGALDTLRLADTEAGTSLADVRPFLLQSVNSFSDEQCVELCQTLCTSALNQSNAYYVIGLMGDLIDNEPFRLEMARRVKGLAEKYIAGEEGGEGDELRALPEFFAQLAIARWRRGRDKPIEGSNEILFIVVSVVTGWVEYIKSKCREDPTPLDAEVPLLIRCATAMCEFCQVGQRGIWMNYLELLDEIFAATKNLLISNLPLTKSTRSSLLQLYLLLNKWTSTNHRRYSTTATQTTYKIG